MGDIDDFQGFERRLQNELERLEQFHERDRQHVKRWVQRNDGRIKDSTMAEYLKNLRETAKRVDQPIVSLTEADFEAAVYDWRRNPEYGQGEGGLSQSTIRNVEFVVRKLLTDLELAEWPEDYELSPPEDTSVRPEDMLRVEDIKALRDGANNLRDIALIEFLANTGGQLSLIGFLRIGDVDLDVLVDGLLERSNCSPRWLLLAGELVWSTGRTFELDDVAVDFDLFDRHLFTVLLSVV